MKIRAALAWKQRQAKNQRSFIIRCIIYWCIWRYRWKIQCQYLS